MLIRRTLAKHGNILPRAWNALAAIPDHFTYHLDHGKRHPKSAYGNSLRDVSSQWLKVFNELERLYTEHYWEQQDTRFPAVLSEYRELLYRLNEHFDACYTILRCLCLPDSAKLTQFDSHFLDKAKLPGWKQFRDFIEAYQKNHIGLLVNTQKHSQGELCSIYFHSDTEFRPGYYLQDVLPDGALGPSPKLHPGSNTAFSFARDLMMHYWWQYRTGDILADTLRTALRVLHNYDLREEPHQASVDDWITVANKCGDIRLEFFPDEIPKPYPRILFQPEPLAISLEFPTTARGHRIAEMRVSTHIRVDGEHRTNKLPYLVSSVE